MGSGYRQPTRVKKMSLGSEQLMRRDSYNKQTGHADKDGAHCLRRRLSVQRGDLVDDLLEWQVLNKSQFSEQG